MYEPTYLDATESVENLVDSIRNTIEFWLMVHTDAETWANDWASGDFENLLENVPVLGNSYFSFDLKDACIRQWADENAHFFSVCSVCHCLGESLDCGCEDAEELDASVDALVEFFEDVGFHGTFPEYMIRDAMETDGFDAYTDALSGTIAGVVDECETALKMFDDAANGRDLLTAAMSSSSILHINGDILEDYGDQLGLDTNTVDVYRDEGLTALFEREEILEFMES